MNVNLIGAVLGALLFGAIAAERTGHWFGGAIIGLFIGAVVVAVLQAVSRYFKEAASAPSTRVARQIGDAARDYKEAASTPSTRAAHKHIYILAGSFVVALFVYLGLQPSEVVLPSIPQVSQPVEVLGYTRSDGSHVDPYNRALPGERQRNDQRVEDWATAGGRQMDLYRSERTTAFLWAFGVFGVGCVWSYRVHKHVV